MKNYMTISDIKRRVLIVDDEPINRELLGTMLPARSADARDGRL